MKIQTEFVRAEMSSAVRPKGEGYKPPAGRGTKSSRRNPFLLLIGIYAFCVSAVLAQLVDKTQSPNNANAGINKSLEEQIGAGRGDIFTPLSSLFIIQRDPFRSVRRGRQLFQRKFTRAQGQGPRVEEGDLNTTPTIGAGLSDSCAGCHGRPRGSAGFGGDVVTRPDSRDAPHLFGLGLKEMLADEITTDLRSLRALALEQARRKGRSVTMQLTSKGIRYGSLTAHPNGSVDTSHVEGVDPDLRVRPFFLHGGTISMREFIVGALQAEMGLQAVDPDLARAARGKRAVTPAGMVLDGSQDTIEAPPTDDPHADPDRDGVRNEIPTSLIDHLEFYFLHYFKAGRGEETPQTERGRELFEKTGCTSCHISDLQINFDRRVADVETAFDPDRGIFNRLFATAQAFFVEMNDGSGFPSLKLPKRQPFLVKNIFTDFKRHDLGPNLHEINYDGTLRKEFLTTPLWGVGSTAPYGHDGRSMNLTEVILRHGGEAREARDAFARLDAEERDAILAFLNTLILFPPDDTASNLDPGDPNAPGFPQFGHGSIKLTVLFNNPKDVE